MPEIQSIIRLLGENEGGQVKKALPCSFLRYPVAAYGAGQGGIEVLPPAAGDQSGFGMIDFFLMEVSLIC
jgi:hypothetical protein